MVGWGGVVWCGVVVCGVVGCGGMQCGAVRCGAVRCCGAGTRCVAWRQVRNDEAGRPVRGISRGRCDRDGISGKNAFVVVYYHYAVIDTWEIV